MSDGRLAAQFLAQLDEARRARLPDANALEEVLAQQLAAARAAWPGVALSDEKFLAHLARHLPDDGAPLLRLRELRGDELYLARACADGDAEALRAFEAAHLRDVRGALARLDRDGLPVDDVLADLRLKLLVQDGDAPPRILEYAGRGELRGWLRITAVRAAFRQRDRERAGAATDEDDALADRSAPAGNPELDVLKSQHGDAFRRAFREAMAALTSRDQLLLRQHFLDGLTLEQLGALHGGVNRSTVLRWIRRVQELLLKKTRRALVDELHLTAAECDSLLRDMQSQFAGSVRRILESP